jgi:signal peptidase II
MLLLATVGCDRVTKHLATATLAEAPPQSYFADTLQLQYAENAGGFLSLGSGMPDWARTGLFTFGVGFTLIALAVLALKDRWTGLPLAGASLVFAGGVSNLIDRIARGTVIDFMSIGIGPLRTGIFNVADVAIMIGLVLIVMKVPLTGRADGAP